MRHDLQLGCMKLLWDPAVENGELVELELVPTNNHRNRGRE